MNTISFLSIPAGIVPEQEALVCEGTRLSYAEVLSRARRLAGALARLGVGRGTRVAALGVNCHRSVEAYYATATLGGVFIPLNYRAKLPELEHMLKAGRARVLFVGTRYLHTVQSLAPALPELETIIGIDGPSGSHPGFEEPVAGATELESEAEPED